MNRLYLDRSLTARLKLAVIKTMKALGQEEKNLNQLQSSLLDKHVEKDDNGNYKKVETNVKGSKSIIFVYKDKIAYQEELEQVSEQTFEMPEKFIIDDLLSSELNPAEIDTLLRLKMIKEEAKNGGSKE